MKIRTGFVSNSSSSSFIFAIAEVTDRNQLIKDFDGFKPFIGDYIFTKKQLIDNNVGYGHRKISHDLSTGSFEFDIDQLQDDKEYLYFNETGPEGDAYFMNRNDGSYYCDIDYDIDLSDYNQHQVTIYTAITENKSGLKHIESHYQAGRDG